MSVTCIGASTLTQESLTLDTGPKWKGTISRPSGTANGHQMLLFVFAEYPTSGSVGVTTPAGWTLSYNEDCGDFGSAFMFTRIAASEPSSYDLSYTYSDNAEKYTTVWVVYDGLKVPISYDLPGGWQDVSDPGGSTPLTAPSKTVTAQKMVMDLFVKWTSGSLSIPAQTPMPTSRATASFFSDTYAIISDFANQGAGTYQGHTGNIVDNGTANAFVFDISVVLGAAAITLGGVTLSSTGIAKAQGALAKTLDALTIAATGKTIIRGQGLSFNLGTLLSTATGTNLTHAAGALQLGALTTTATGAVKNNAAAALSLGGLTLIAAGIARASGAAAITLGALTLASTIASVPIGQAFIQLADLTLVASAIGVVHGQLARTLDSVGLVAAGITRISGALTVTLDDVVTAPTLDGAYAITTHSVRVLMSAEPLHVSRYDVGDALNPLTWSVTDPSTGFVYTVVGVEMPDDVTVDLLLLEALGDHLHTFRVSSVGLLGPGGAPSADLAALFVGAVQTLDPIQSVALDRFLDRDLANPPLQAEFGGFGGTIKIGSDGDYETEYGVALNKKLIIRRLSTPRGAFPHLPEYGVGILEKEPITSNMIALRGEIEAQIKQETDVEQARASLLLSRSNVLQIDVRVKLRGNGATFDMQMSTANGTLVEI